jgi:hypothetical protein
VHIAERDIDDPAAALMERADCVPHLRGDRRRIVEPALVVHHLHGNDAHRTCEDLGANAFAEIAERSDASNLGTVAPHIGGAETLRDTDRLHQ